MPKVERLLVPWYKYPPFSKDRVGGLSVAVWELTAELGRRGIVVDMLTPDPPTEGLLTPSGVRVIGSELGRKFFNNQPLEREEERALDDYDRILSIANYAARTLSSCNRTRDRIVRQIHAIGQDRGITTYVSLTPTVPEYLKMVLAKRNDEKNLRLLRGSKTLCVSEFLRQRMERGLESRENLYFVPNGLDTEQFRPIQVKKDFELLFIGRFQRAKGLDLFLKALNSIATEKKEVYSTAIIGAFSEEERNYLLQCLQSQVRKGTVFLGSLQREEMPIAINRAKLVVVPTRYESFGLPALEAIACGIPVVAARVGGLPEIIDQSVGTLVEPNDYRALAEGIHKLIHAEDFARKVLVAGPAKARRYDWRRVGSEIQQAIFS
jgi:D-inositol-3-phosphate glycosyltransferase